MVGKRVYVGWTSDDSAITGYRRFKHCAVQVEKDRDLFVAICSCNRRPQIAVDQKFLDAGQAGYARQMVGCHDFAFKQKKKKQLVSKKKTDDNSPRQKILFFSYFFGLAQHGELDEL